LFLSYSVTLQGFRNAGLIFFVRVSRVICSFFKRQMIKEDPATVTSQPVICRSYNQ
jgi:hypothetical protein